MERAAPHAVEVLAFVMAEIGLVACTLIVVPILDIVDTGRVALLSVPNSLIH